MPSNISATELLNSAVKGTNLDGAFYTDLQVGVESLDSSRANLMNVQSFSAEQHTKTVLDATMKYLRNSNMISPTADLDGTVIGLESINTAGDAGSALSTAFGSVLDTYLDDLGFKRGSSLRNGAQKAAMVYMAQARANPKTDNAFYSHFTTDKKSDAVNCATRLYAPNIQNSVMPSAMPGIESFGTTMDRVQSDLPAGLAVNVNQSNAAVIDKLVHRIPQPNPYVTFRVEYGQVYDMLKSNDESSEVRNQGSHLIPFIKLFTNPKSVSNELQEITPLSSNDKNGLVYKDGYLVAGVAANLFDLNKQAGKLGYDHLNYTDLVSENVTIDKLIVKLTADGTSEEFTLDVGQYNGSRFVMPANANDSSIRTANPEYAFLFKKTNKTSTDQESKILAKCTDDDNIIIKIFAGAAISLKTSDVKTAISATAAAHTSKSGVQVSSEVSELLSKLTVQVVAIKIKAYASEENLRKSNLAVRTNVAPFAYEISCSRNVMIDWSFGQTQDQMSQDGVIGLATEATALGIDHRGINIIVEQLQWTYAQNVELKKDGEFREINDRINNSCVAGQLVNPTALVGTINLGDVENIRSSDITGDIREAVEYSLLTKFAQFYQDSLYRLKLGGEKPRFRVLTSPLVLSTIFQIPHIHNHIQQMSEEGVDSEGITYRRVLNDGTILEFAVANYQYLRDRIIIVPIVNDEKDVLNFGGNYDCGTFVATYDPQLGNGANRRMFTNSRTQVISTNPSGMYLSVVGLDDVLSLDANVGLETGDVLPDPSTLIKQL